MVLNQLEILNQNHISWHRVELIFCGFVVKILPKVEENEKNFPRVKKEENEQLKKKNMNKTY